MNINELKELVKHCVYIEKGITCMSDTYYNDMIQTIENLQSKIDKAIEMIKFDKKNRMWDLGEGNIMILQEKRVNELLDILKEDNNALYNLIDEQGETNNGKTTDI